MRQFEQANEILTHVIKVESTCTEALFLLCWTLTANLVVQQNKTASKTQGNSETTASSVCPNFQETGPDNATQNMASLQMAQDCLAILKRKASKGELQIPTEEQTKVGRLECYSSQASVQSLST